MSFKYLFFALAFSTLIMTGVLVKNSQEIEVLKIETERETEASINAIKVQIMIDQVCGGRGGSFINTTLECY